MPTESSATLEGPSLIDDSQNSHPDPVDQLTDQHDELLKLFTGLGTLQSLAGIDANAVQNRAVKEYVDGNLQLWRKNWGLQEPEQAKDEDVGHTVRVDSDDKHYHWHMTSPAAAAPSPPAVPTPPPAAPVTASQPSLLSKLMPYIVAGSLGAGGVGIGTWLASGGDVPSVTDTDTDTRSTLRPYTGPE